MTTFDWATLRTRAHPCASNDQRRAVVIGASLAGLLVARVLSEHFDEVMLLERDELPSGNAHRKATPHAQHAHRLARRLGHRTESLRADPNSHCDRLNRRQFALTHWVSPLFALNPAPSLRLHLFAALQLKIGSSGFGEGERRIGS